MKSKIYIILFASFLTYKLQAAEVMPISIEIEVVRDDHTFIAGEYKDVIIGTGVLIKRLAQLPSKDERYSDHEMMLISSENYSAISYNIGEPFEHKFGSEGEKKWDYFNNGFLAEDEKKEEYKQRITRIFERIARVSAEQKSKIICLQEAAQSEELLELITKYLANYNMYFQKSNIILVDKSLSSSFINFETKRKIMAVYIKDFNTVIINVHAAWIARESEEGDEAQKSPMIADFNNMLLEVGKTYPDAAVEIYGDFNREDHIRLDEYRTVDIREFAKHLALKDAKVYSSNNYTNIRYISPNLNKKYDEDVAGVLTASDYFITGKFLK